MSPRRLLAVAAGALALAAVTQTAAPASAAAQSPVPYTVRTLHFKATGLGPNDDTTCDVVGDLYTPTSPKPAGGFPAILTTNGFGGSKDDQKPEAEALTRHGYVVLSYSGLGFGGSGCNIELDDRDWDGKAANQLIEFLGGRAGISFSDQQHTQPVAPPDDVELDNPKTYDPRVGMVGGSYGGEIQFAAAAVSQKVDAIIPIITWNDLGYSLTPGNGQLSPSTASAGLPGVLKREWAAFFTVLGFTEPLQHLGMTPFPPSTCPGFDPRVCVAFQQAAVHGYADGASLDLFRHASVATYMSQVKIPTLLAQGQADSLFDLQESVATYNQLRARHVPVQLLWQSWGHSRLAPAPGEFVSLIPGLAPGSSQAPVDQTYEGKVFLDWFDYWLKGPGSAPKPALDFSYFRDWAYRRPSGNDGGAAAAAAYGHAASYPAGRKAKLYLSGRDRLVAARSAVRSGTATYRNVSMTPTSYSETSVVGIALPFGAPDPQPPPFDGPGTAAGWTSAPFTADVDVVGVPTADIRLSAPSVARQQTASPDTHLVLFEKLYDVAPNGAKALVQRLVSPVRVADVGKPLHVTLPGQVHRYAKGHRVEFVVAASDTAYSGNTTPFTVSVPTSEADPGVVTLPVLSSAGISQSTGGPSAATPQPRAPTASSGASAPPRGGVEAGEGGTAP